MIKKLITSRWLKVLFSVGLLWLAFKKVGIIKILGEISGIPWWFVVAMLIYLSLTFVIGAWRWAYIVLDEVHLVDILVFLKAGFVATFYSLFLPSAIGGDVVKWLPLIKIYPKIPKSRLAGSVLVDRIIGFSAFVPMGLTSLLIGKNMGFQFPDILLWLFGGLMIGIIIFYGVVYLVDFEKYIKKLPFGYRILEVLLILKRENRRKVMTCLLLSVLMEPIWILPTWFYSLVLKANIGLLPIFMFVPVVNLLLVLPISVAGFGAREAMYLYFYSQAGVADEKILAVSAMNGVMWVILALIGGLLSLF